MYVKKYILFIITIVVLIVMACNPPDDGNDIDDIIDDDDDKITEKITNLKVSLLERNDGIYLAWENPDVDSYKVYRYTTISSETPEIQCDTTDNFFKDITAVINTPYFYSVACIKDSVEYDQSLKVMGLYSNLVDDYESENNDISLLDPDAVTFPQLNNEKEVVLYSCPNGLPEKLENDIDWYKYKGPNTTLFFEIQLSEETTLFADDDIHFRYYFNGEYGPEQHYMMGRENCITFSKTIIGEIEVFFKVDINCTYHNNTIIENYTVRISDSFKNK